MGYYLQMSGICAALVFSGVNAGSMINIMARRPRECIARCERLVGCMCIHRTAAEPAGKGLYWKSVVNRSYLPINRLINLTFDSAVVVKPKPVVSQLIRNQLLAQLYSAISDLLPRRATHFTCHDTSIWRSHVRPVPAFSPPVRRSRLSLIEFFLETSAAYTPNRSAVSISSCEPTNTSKRRTRYGGAARIH